LINKYKTRQICFSEEGEDILLNRIFKEKFGLNYRGFYVDIGAYDPKKISNTYLLYRQGWSGINVDCMPGVVKRFNKIRPKDINLNYAISNTQGKTLSYCIFEAPFGYPEATINGFLTKKQQNKYINNGAKLIKKIDIKTVTLDYIFNKYLPKYKIIDLLDVDIEGKDLDALRSNNWIQYRPRYIYVESYNLNFENLHKNSIYNFLINKGYRLKSRLYYSCLYELIKQPKMVKKLIKPCMLNKVIKNKECNIITEKSTITYKIPKNTSIIEIELLKHEYSSNLIIRNQNNITIRKEACFRKLDKQGWTSIYLDVNNNDKKITLSCKENNKSKGNEIWIKNIYKYFIK